MYLLFYIVVVFGGNKQIIVLIDKLLIFLESIGIINWFVFGILRLFYWDVVECIEKLIGKWGLKKIGIGQKVYYFRDLVGGIKGVEQGVGMVGY